MEFSSASSEDRVAEPDPSTIPDARIRALRAMVGQPVRVCAWDSGTLIATRDLAGTDWDYLGYASRIIQNVEPCPLLVGCSTRENPITGEVYWLLSYLTGPRQCNYINVILRSPRHVGREVVYGWGLEAVDMDRRWQRISYVGVMY
jgi:hypothetical protein